MSAAIRAAARRAATALASSTARPVAAKAAAVPAPRRGLATLVSRRGGVLSSTAGPHSAAWPASTAARPQHRRATAAFASAAPNTGLSDALDDEIKYEADNYDAPEGIAKPPSGWDLEEAPGDTLVSLTRAGLAPGEVVTVELVVDEQDEGDDEGAALFEGGDEDEDEAGDATKRDDDDDDELTFDDSIVFTAAVARGDSALVFECRSDGSYLQVLSVSLEPNPDAAGEEGEEGDDLFDDNSTAYLGPLYDELDERLQAEFEAYLAARGVDAEFGGWLAEFAGDKEQREYVAWLRRVKEFVSQK